MEFPTAMLGVALGTVLLPSLSRAAAAKDGTQYSQLLDWGLRLVFLLAVPATIGLALMAEPLTAMLFHYGKFTANDVQMTRLAVLGYSVGLLGLIAIKVLAPAFFARQDVRTPLKIGIAVLIVTQLMNLLFVPIFKHAGLTLSISIGALINALWLYIGLRRAKVYQPSAGWLTYMTKLVIAGALMAGFVFFASAQFQWVAMNTQPLIRIAAALGIVALAGALYAASLTAMGIRPREFMRKST
jgi:putative peptidoglycan lipid II flippase